MSENDNIPTYAPKKEGDYEDADALNKVQTRTDKNKNKKSPIIAIISIVVAVVILIAGFSCYYFLTKNKNTNNAQENATSAPVAPEISSGDSSKPSGTPFFNQLSSSVDGYVYKKATTILSAQNAGATEAYIITYTKGNDKAYLLALNFADENSANSFLKKNPNGGGFLDQAGFGDAERSLVFWQNKTAIFQVVASDSEQFKKDFSL